MNKRTTLPAIFLIALVVRVIAVVQYADAPNFDNPIGDSEIYTERALRVVSGEIVGDEIPFHSSPLYAYFIALFLKLGGGFLAVRVAQATLGAVGCVLIALLARRLAADNDLAALLAGLAAVFYGALVFFDIDLLMICITVPLITLGLLLLLRAREEASAAGAAAAGIAIGLAATDKPNILLFVPVAAWFLAASCRLRPGRISFRPAIVFIGCVATTILPITVRNVAVGGDLVLLSSNAGVNLFIGNNPDARGVFDLPRSSGLRNHDLHGSSVAVAERAAGRELKPSEVSRYWTGRALRFVKDNPEKAGMLVLRKLGRLVGAYEIPNHLNFYYLRDRHVPILTWAAVGAWLIFPLGILGLFRRGLQGFRDVDRLALGFLLTYSASLLPFFVTARYRLPIVPLLICYAAIVVCELPGRWRTISRRSKALLLVGLVAAALAVHFPARRFGYSFNQIAMAMRYFDRAQSDPDRHDADLERSVVLLKWAGENAPGSADVHHNLGVAYDHLGFYSGAMTEFERALAIEPERRGSRVGLDSARLRLIENADRLAADRLPRTPFEQARTARAGGDPSTAERYLDDLLDRDPFHFLALNELAMLHTERGQPDSAIPLLRRAVRLQPAEPVLYGNLASAYARAGRDKDAIRVLDRCIEINPASELCRKQLDSFTPPPRQPS